MMTGSRNDCMPIGLLSVLSFQRRRMFFTVSTLSLVSLRCHPSRCGSKLPVGHSAAPVDWPRAAAAHNTNTSEKSAFTKEHYQVWKCRVKAIVRDHGLTTEVDLRFR